MGKLIVDGAADELTGPESVADAFEAARARLGPYRRVVRVTLNGLPVAWGDRSPDWLAPFGPNSELRIETADARDLARALVDRVIDVLPKVAERHREAARRIRAGADDGFALALEAMGFWRELVEGLGQLTKLVAHDAGANEFTAAVASLQPLQLRVAEQLDEVRRAGEVSDLVLLADLIDYELAPFTEEWSRALADLRRRMTEIFAKEG